MRFAIIIGLVAGVSFGCASKNKTDAAASAPAAATATADKAKADMKNATKDAKKMVKEAATAATTAAGEKVECKLGGETRVLEIRAKDKGCELAYTKAGQENVVASSMNGNAHCETVSTRIKDKLTEAGFTCN